MGLALLAIILVACESSECKLAKERETMAVLAKQEADMKFFPTAKSRKIRIEVNKRLMAEKLEENKLPPLIQPYHGQEEYERKLLKAAVYANSEANSAKSLRIHVCK